MSPDTPNAPPSRNDLDGGLIIQKDVPATVEAFLQKADDLGLTVQKASRFGFRPEVDRSGTVPIGEPGAPIVDALRGLRDRRRGRKPLNGAKLEGRAKEMLDQAEQAQVRKRRTAGA